MFTQGGYVATFGQEHLYNVERKRERNSEKGSEMNILVTLLSLVQNTYKIGDKPQVSFSFWEALWLGEKPHCAFESSYFLLFSFFRLGKQALSDASQCPLPTSCSRHLACPLPCPLDQTAFLRRYVEMIDSGRSSIQETPVELIYKLKGLSSLFNLETKCFH